MKEEKTEKLVKKAPVKKESDPYLDELESLEDFAEDAPKAPIAPKPAAPVTVNQPLAKEGLDFASDISVSLEAVVGRKGLSVKDLLSLRIGQVVEMDRGVHDTVDLVVGGKLIGKGELVDVEGKIGVKVTQIL
ncbi:MAG: FliM/FliN family flagellar motor switch protein [bacterium]|nr:FliM/FliN family flagellar motor switch protein [bacterium]